MGQTKSARAGVPRFKTKLQQCSRCSAARPHTFVQVGLARELGMRSRAKMELGLDCWGLPPNTRRNLASRQRTLRWCGQQAALQKTPLFSCSGRLPSDTSQRANLRQLVRVPTSVDRLGSGRETTPWHAKGWELALQRSVGLGETGRWSKRSSSKCAVNQHALELRREACTLFQASTRIRYRWLSSSKLEATELPVTQ